jgi:predicted DNA-binding mobile mystery protein A
MSSIPRKALKRLRLRQIDAALAKLRPLHSTPVPRLGWIAELRRALGMTAGQLGGRLGVTKQRVGALQRAEVEGKATIESLRKAADALGCDFVYALIPRERLATMVEHQARVVATEAVRRTAHSMALEGQKPSEVEIARQIAELSAQLAEQWPSTLWATRSSGR